MDSQKRAKNLVKQASIPTGGGGGKQLITPEIVIPELCRSKQNQMSCLMRGKGIAEKKTITGKNIKKKECIVSENKNIPPKSGKKLMRTILHISNAVFLIILLTLPAAAQNPSTPPAAPVILSESEESLPTLTKLHNAGILMPNGEVYPESAYTLTEVSAPGENTITKYITNADNTITAKYFRIDIKTEYGTGPDTQTWGFEKDAKGNNILVKDPTNASTTITVHYDSTSPQTQINNTTDRSTTPIGCSFMNLSKTGTSREEGGAIFNDGTNAKLGDITADFIGNNVKVQGNMTPPLSYNESTTAIGGGIYNRKGPIGNITGDFIGNYAQATGGNAESATAYATAYATAEANGGGISNDGPIGNITGDFIGNYAQATGGSAESANASAYATAEAYAYANAYGGGIFNYGTIGNITGDFIGNYAQATGGSAESANAFASAYAEANGGGIFNNYAETIGNITGDFIGNYAQATGGSAESANASANATASAEANGGGISNDGKIGNITGDFIGNYAQATGGSAEPANATATAEANGGGIFNNYAGRIGNITGDFIGNYAQATTGTQNGVLDTAVAQGGAIHNYDGTIGEQDADGNVIGGIINSSFLNNYAKADGTNAVAKGGAIYNEYADLNIIADNGVSLFSGNYTETNGVRESNAIYMATAGKTLTLKSKNNGIIQFDDKIDGEAGYNVVITGDDTSNVILNNTVHKAIVTSENVTLTLGKNNVFENSDFTINSGTLSLINGASEQQTAQSFNINGDINLAADVNLAESTMDTLPTNTIVDPSAQIGVNYLNLLNDALTDETRIQFAPDTYSNQVAFTGASPIAYSPIWKYQVDYLKETGEFLFTRGAGSNPGGNPSDNFNPAVLPTPVNTQAGGYTTQLQTFNYAFQHSDTFMQIPAAQRFAIKNQNKYALSPTDDATDVGVFSPLLTKYETGGIWFKPYASFENIPLKNGPKVNNINYGTLVGFDSNLKSIKHGWERVLTGYIGYNGATQNFSGVTSNQNGGILGTTATFYKGNFFNATTLSVGATAGSNNTMYGSEDYTMLLAGIADKFGYNFEFKEGKYIIQPSMLLSYSFVNTFDYRNAAGVNIQSDPLNALQLAPGIKFIMNTKNGWQPYIGVNMVWNIMDQTKVKANDVRLPSMSIDPYIEYGVGVQRKWGERFMGYAQAMVHNGGRNGISLNGGFRWAIGKK